MEKMMEQVARHLILRSYDDNDWEVIRNIFKERYGKSPKRSVRPKCRETLPGFGKWLDSGFADGDIVRVDGYVGIYADKGDRQILAAFRKDDSPIVVADKLITGDLEHVDEGTAASFMDRLRMDGYGFRISMSSVVPLTLVPAFTRVSYDGRCGIIGGYGDGTVSMLAEVDGDVLRLDASYPTFSIDFRNASPKEIRQIDRVLLANGLRYDPASRTLRKAVSRAATGERFWYINENFGVSAGIEKNTKTQDLRYRNGNYFLTLSDAMSFQKKLRELVDGYEKGDGE